MSAEPHAGRQRPVKQAHVDADELAPRIERAEPKHKSQANRLQLSVILWFVTTLAIWLGLAFLGAWALGLLR